MMKKEVHIVICGAGPVQNIACLVRQALMKDWGIQMIATQAALQILKDNQIDIEYLSNITGRSLVSEAREHPLSIAEAIIVAPATRNTIVQLASNEKADTKPSYAVVHLKDAVEAKIPIVILPSIKQDIMTPDFLGRVDDLRNKGVEVLLGKGGVNPTNASSRDGPISFPWHLAVEKVESILYVPSY